MSCLVGFLVLRKQSHALLLYLNDKLSIYLVLIPGYRIASVDLQLYNTYF